MKNITKFTIIIAIVAMCVQTAFAQNKQVRDGLRKIANGKIAEAQAILDDLMNKYPVDPGICYLQASLTSDANKAIFLYRKILNEFAKSEWTDDAYWRLVQYYAVKGDTASAVKALEQFKTFQPTSEFISVASDVVFVSLMYHRNHQDGASASPAVEARHAENTHKDAKPHSKDVELESKEKATTVKTTATATATASHKDEKVKAWGLQAGVYSTIEAAKEVAKKFQDKRLRNQIIDKDVNGKKMFAVIIGRYKTKESAEAEKHNVSSICNCEIILYTFK